jgi:CDP-diacylglycerol--serine O-phosphatidyltransferase
MRNGRLAPSLADLVTAANAVCGFLAIAVVARAWTGGATPDGRLPDGDLVAAVTLIIAGAALDSVDGIVARRRGGSPLGEHLEVMSDVVTFGLAPAVLFAVDAAAYDAPWSGLALGVGAAYMVAALLRLARYIVLSNDAAAHQLTGFPAPPAAMAMVAIVALHSPAPLALGTVVCIAALMVASFEFPVLTGAIGRFMIGWFVFGFLAIFTLPLWVPAAVTLAILAYVLLAIARHGRLRPTTRLGRDSGRRRVAEPRYAGSRAVAHSRIRAHAVRQDHVDARSEAD